MKRFLFAGAILGIAIMAAGCTNGNIAGRAGSKQITSYSLVTSTAAASSTVFVGDTSDCNITVTNSGTHASDMIAFKFIGSSRDSTPQTSTTTDGWAYINSTNQDSGTAVAGSTGYTGITKGTYRYSLLDDNLAWVGVVISSSTNPLSTDATSTVLFTADCQAK